MNLLTRFLTLAEKARALVPGAVHIEPLDLDRDWPDIETLLRDEEWPFVRADLELGDAQPGDVSFVARRDGAFAGFFTAHLFPGVQGPVGYLDMMVIHPDHRGQTVARPLYLRCLEALYQAGAVGLVVHTTNDSARLIELLGFQAGRSFTLLTRDPAPGGRGELQPAHGLGPIDAAAFGVPRPAWTQWLTDDRRVQIVARGGATAVLRPRTPASFSFDGCYADDPADLEPLVAALVAARGAEHGLMAFAATDGPLHRAMEAHGFTVPDFFVPIGPLVEWRQGRTAGVGEGGHSLLWL